MVEEGEALTADALCETYDSINRKYYGENVEYDEEISYEWARIPHFYYNFYVYQYATSFCAIIYSTANPCSMIESSSLSSRSKTIGGICPL